MPMMKWTLPNMVSEAQTPSKPNERERLVSRLNMLLSLHYSELARASAKFFRVITINTNGIIKVTVNEKK